MEELKHRDMYILRAFLPLLSTKCSNSIIKKFIYDFQKPLVQLTKAINWHLDRKLKLVELKKYDFQDQDLPWLDALSDIPGSSGFNSMRRKEELILEFFQHKQRVIDLNHEGSNQSSSFGETRVWKPTRTRSKNISGASGQQGCPGMKGNDSLLSNAPQKSR